MTQDLTKIEVECLQWASRGKRSDEISEIIGLSEHAVNQYFAVASKKLNAVNRIHAVGNALRLMIIE